MSYIGNPILSTDFPLDVFSGNGSTTSFTMQIAPASVNSIIVVVSGVTQAPATYTISGTTLTFTAAPPSGTGNIIVRYLGVSGIPNVPSAASVTQSSLSAGVAGTGPAFSAYQTSTTSLANNAFTKVLFDTEEFDTNNCFTSSTFTPTVAGYYQINAYVGTSANSAMMICSIFKNGSEFKRGTTAVSNSMYNSSCCCVVYLNGSTDYLDIRGYQNSGGAQNTSTGLTGSFVSGAMVRNA